MKQFSVDISGNPRSELEQNSLSLSLSLSSPLSLCTYTCPWVWSERREPRERRNEIAISIEASRLNHPRAISACISTRFPGGGNRGGRREVVKGSKGEEGLLLAPSDSSAHGRYTAITRRRIDPAARSPTVRRISRSEQPSLSPSLAPFPSHRPSLSLPPLAEHPFVLRRGEKGPESREAESRAGYALGIIAEDVGISGILGSKNWIWRICRDLGISTEVWGFWFDPPLWIRYVSVSRNC